MEQTTNGPTMDEPTSSTDNAGGMSDAQQNKGIAMLSYIIFFLPLLSQAKKSAFAMYHANQGLLVLLFALAVNIIGSIIPILGWFIILPIGNIMTLVFIIIGIINASKGLMKPLPLIGTFSTILKV
jgi:uncharacterized membrane protein